MMDAAAEPRYPKLVDLTGVFDGHPELVWIDDMHVTPEANLVVARKITEFVNAPRGSGQPLEGEER